MIGPDGHYSYPPPVPPTLAEEFAHVTQFCTGSRMVYENREFRVTVERKEAGE